MKLYGPLEVAQIEWFLNSGKPAASNYPYRVIWVTDQKVAQVSDGTNWVNLGGGGGGGGLEWLEDANAPIASIANNIQVFSFAATLGQSLYALLKVPNAYAGGTQIRLRLDFYSPDSSGDALMQTVATLVRQGTDLISSTTNQRTSTNSAVTLSGGTVNIPQAVTLDLTSSTGTINSVAVAAGDYIKIQLTRGTDTATSDLQVPKSGADVTFT